MTKMRKRYLTFIAVCIPITGAFVFFPSDPNGEWASKHFIMYSDGSYARLLIDKEIFMIGHDLPDHGTIKRSSRSRRFDCYDKGEFLFSVKVFGPIMIVIDRESNIDGWCWKVGGQGEAGEKINHATGAAISR
jgi:hypothetical protein